MRPAGLGAALFQLGRTVVYDVADLDEEVRYSEQAMWYVLRGMDGTPRRQHERGLGAEQAFSNAIEGCKAHSEASEQRSLGARRRLPEFSNAIGRLCNFPR